MPTDWNIEAKNILKTELVKRNITHEQLVEYLDLIGVKETKASIDSKISRGTFKTSFLLQCLKAIECKSLTFENNYNLHEHKAEYKKIMETNFYTNSKTNKRYIDISNLKYQYNSDMEELKVVSLFSGAGGLDIGLEQAGFKTVACIENDIHCRTTLKHNRPDWKVLESGVIAENGIIREREPGNIRDITEEEVLDIANLQKGEAALVVGGAPCQPFSNIGKKEGQSDKKNGDLFLEFVRMVKAIKPKAFLFENVAGITHSKHNSVLKYMIENFAGSGYGISYTILNSANYGVGQRRERFFLLGIKNVPNPAFPLPTNIKDIKSWEVFIKDLNHKPNYTPKNWNSLKSILDKLPNDYKNRKDYALMNISAKVLDRMTYIEQGKNFKVLPMEKRPNCWKSGKHQGNDTFGRMIASLPSVTIRTAAYNPAKGMYIHPFENRGLDTIEMAAIQDFPFDWEFKCHGRDKITLVSGGKQIGNAVPPGLARAIGLAIMKQIQFSLEESFQKQLELVPEY